ncbi:hypothetical protein H8K52_20140 [Undibacterium seohonense]|uniref:FHA domain-containing protein n=1 Tax=Undibacterium seohonense TaxID=1344950 RepID=A0ABR6XA89_9BURK|nr:hypothetical protein [Undibacterium seohonense]MBC3809652.1 hypothetical protein [Undibacterium seohonense]
MKRFKEFLKEVKLNESKEKKLTELSLALEHQTYKNISGTQNSLRIDPQNTSTLTQRHAHVYAKPNGGGKQLYSVNLDGSGHDGSSGTVIPASHADHLRRLGFEIPVNLALESLDFESLSPELYEICILDDDV